MIKKYSGIDTHRLMYYLKDVDTSALTEAIGMTEEAIKSMQEAETKHQTQLVALKQSANNVPEKLEEISKLEVKHEETWRGREEDITKKVEAVADAGKEKKGSSLAERGLAEIEGLEQDVEWKKHLQKVVDKIAAKKDRASGEDNALKKKDQEKITKQYAQYISSFDTNNLPQEHARAVQEYLDELRNESFFRLLKNSKTEDVIPVILSSTSQQRRFTDFMLAQLNTAIIQMLQSGQKEQYSAIKHKLIEVFEFTAKHDNLKNYLGDFVASEVVLKGISTVLNLKNKKPSGLLDFYTSQEQAAQNLNPYTLRLTVNTL